MDFNEYQKYAKLFDIIYVSMVILSTTVFTIALILDNVLMGLVPIFVVVCYLTIIQLHSFKLLRIDKEKYQLPIFFSRISGIVGFKPAILLVIVLIASSVTENENIIYIGIVALVPISLISYFVNYPSMYMTWYKDMLPSYAVVYKILKRENNQN